MTNKGTKYLELQLSSLKHIQRETAAVLDEERVKNADLNLINKKMEDDLLLVCNCNLWRAFWRLRALRADLKRRTKKSKKS